MQDKQTQILDFVSYRKKTVAKKALRSKVQTQAYEMLKVIQGLVFDYEAQMVAIAQEVAGDNWVEKHGRSPAEQIADDLRRLHNFSQALENALDHGATTLGEAAKAIRHGEDEELIATLDYILSSDYVGFQAITKILEAVVFTADKHFFNAESIVATWKDLEAAGFEYGVGPIAAICFEEALAI
ncbi:MAG TPA: hypothetical protein VJR29_08840 [bacterium]|nr:hypothetical protein [bacterium]